MQKNIRSLRELVTIISKQYVVITEQPVKSPLIVYICSYASSHGVKLNPSKCKELRIDFLQYTPSDLPPLQMSGSIIEQVPSYKLLGVHLSHNLSWSIHCDYIVKRARKRLYVLRVLMKSGLPPADLIQVYCSLVRPILEYASPLTSLVI